MRNADDLKYLFNEVMHGHLHFLKSEYIHVLYRCIIEQLIKKIRSYRAGEERAVKTNSSFSVKREFIAYPRYYKEIEYLEALYMGEYDPQNLDKDPEFSRIASPNYEIYLSRYAFQELKTLIQFRGMQELSRVLFSQNARMRIVESDNTITENFVGRPATIAKPGDPRDSGEINRRPYVVGMVRDQFNFLCKLQEIIARKKNPLDKAAVASVPNKAPVEKSSTNFFSGCPEYKNKFLYDFSKDYVGRRKVADGPSVLAIRLNDKKESVTVVETTRCLKAVVLGFGSGALRVFALTQDAKSGDREEYTRENQRLFLGEDAFATPAATDSTGGAPGGAQAGPSGGASGGPANFLAALGRGGGEAGLKLVTAEVECLGHSGPVTSVSLAYDSFSFLSASADCTVRLWNTRTGLCLAVFRGHCKTVWAVRYAPKGYFFASGGSDRVALLWATNKATPVKKFFSMEEPVKDELTFLDFSKNLIYLISASADRTVRLWSIDDERLVRVFYCDALPTAVELNEVGDTIVIGDSEGEITIWNVENYNRVARVSFEDGLDIRGLALTYDEDHLMILTSNRVAVFDFNKFKETRSKDVFKKFEGESEKAELAKPFWQIHNPALDVMFGLFTFRNVAVVFLKSTEA